MNYNATTYTLFSRPYLDTYNQCYKNIVTINLEPKGPLAKIVRRINFVPLSTFKQPGPCSRIQNCGLGVVSLHNGCDSYDTVYRDYGYSNYKNGCNLMVVDEVPDLFSFLLSHGYKIDTSLTKMMNGSDIRFQTNNSDKIIAFITYQGDN